MSEQEQLCECSPACDPSNYEGRQMLYPDEAWHNWYFAGKNKKETDEHYLQSGAITDFSNEAFER